MAATVFTGTIYNSLKETLNTVIDDKSDGYESSMVANKWIDTRSMRDHWEEDLEMGGPGLASEKAEGAEIAVGTIREGYRTRYVARTFGLRLLISEEAMEDCKYKEIITMAKRLKRSMYKTIDIDCTNILVRAEGTNYVGGDGLPLASASHTLPHGGTFSNLMAVPVSPSRIGVIAAVSQVRKYPGHDGLIEGYEPKKILCPTEQWGVWEGLVQSQMAPDAGNFSEINVVKGLGLQVVPIKYWTNTTTNWCIMTDCDNGVNIRYRRRPRNRSWVAESHEIMNYGISARWARGWSDPRCILWVGA